MFRKLLPWFITFFSVMLDTSVIPFLTNSNLTPMISLMSVIALGLLLGRRRGALLGLLAGFLMDVMVNDPYGLMTLLMTGAGFFSGFAGRKFMSRMWTSVLTPLALISAMEVVIFFYQSLYARAFQASFLIPAAFRVLIQTAIVQVLYLLYNSILKPKLSRYSAH